ncbi:hypothetical protein KEM55_007900 [Ascosphaera atra]|nr:hypothetical protein KEM55_007900 [Ascosphaera atra]
MDIEVTPHASQTSVQAQQAKRIPALLATAAAPSVTTAKEGEQRPALQGLASDYLDTGRLYVVLLNAVCCLGAIVLRFK